MFNLVEQRSKMALKITMKPREKMIIDRAVIVNGGAACSLFIENEVPILREKNIMKEEDANSPCRKIYFVIQLMYIDQDNLASYHDKYWKLVRGLLDAAPSLVGVIDAISEEIVSSRYYKALKLAEKLILREGEVLSHVRESVTGL